MHTCKEEEAFPSDDGAEDEPRSIPEVWQAVARSCRTNGDLRGLLASLAPTGVRHASRLVNESRLADALCARRDWTAVETIRKIYPNLQDEQLQREVAEQLAATTAAAEISDLARVFWLFVTKCFTLHTKPPPNKPP